MSCKLLVTSANIRDSTGLYFQLCRCKDERISTVANTNIRNLFCKRIGLEFKSKITTCQYLQFYLFIKYFIVENRSGQLRPKLYDHDIAVFNFIELLLKHSSCYQFKFSFVSSQRNRTQQFKSVRSYKIYSVLQATIRFASAIVFSCHGLALGSQAEVTIQAKIRLKMETAPAIKQNTKIKGINGILFV